jgi:hypothetical protein
MELWIGLRGQFAGEEDLGVCGIALLAGTCTFCICIFVNPFCRAVRGFAFHGDSAFLASQFVIGLLEVLLAIARFVFCARLGRAFVREGWRRVVSAWDILARLA